MGNRDANAMYRPLQIKLAGVNSLVYNAIYNTV